MRADCPVCVSEGFKALSRIVVSNNGNQLIATLSTVEGTLLANDEAGLSTAAWERLEAREGDLISFSHLPPLDSMRFVRAKMYGNHLNAEAFDKIIRDVAEEKYSNVELAAFVTACAREMNQEEVISLTKAMINAGSRLSWHQHVVADKHSIGGLPGNRTTPIVVAIVAAAGLIIPKTSSRAITSPAGTADTVEVLTPVNLSLSQIQEVVGLTGGCLAWGGAVKLSPADDILIKVEKALDVDAPGQIVASVLSKKVSAGATHVVIDLPVGPTAKIRSLEDAQSLGRQFEVTGDAVGLKVSSVITDGTQPVGRGIGPSLEARDVLAVLRHEPDAPDDLREKSLTLAAKLLEITSFCPAEISRQIAESILSSGKAWEKFQEICQAQGGYKEPEVAPLQHNVLAEKSGNIQYIDNRKIATLAKLVGAPQQQTAGIYLLVKLGERVTEGQPLFTLHAQSPGELAYALDYLKNTHDIIAIS